MTEQILSEVVKVRIAPETKRALEEIAERNIYTNTISDHVRTAIEQYIRQEAQPEQEQSRVAA